MSIQNTFSNITAPTQFIETNGTRYSYRRFGKSGGVPLLCLQHFTGTLDNWDPAITDPLAAEHDMVLFNSAGVGRSTGEVPDTVGGMADHAFAFVDALGISECDLLGYSLGGMVAQVMARIRPARVRKMVLVATAPRGGQDVMHLDKPIIAAHLSDPSLRGYGVLQKIFFAPTESSQSTGAQFIQRLMQRKEDRDPLAGPAVAGAQIAAFRDWEQFTGERFADLREIRQPTLVMNGVNDVMISVKNSYWLAENLPNAVLLVYPDSGHGSLFQFHEAFTLQVKAFLASSSYSAPY